MKKIIISLTAMLLFTVAASAKFNSGIEVKTVSGPNKENVNAFCHTYDYNYKTIEAALIERFKDEGLKAKKFKNKFYGYLGIKYNHLSDKTIDLYFSVYGSKSAGTVNLLLSHGYSNYVDTNDFEVRRQVSQWFEDVDKDIQNYIIDENIKSEEKDLKKAEKELKSLKKEKSKLEKQIEKNEDKIKEHNATSTVGSKNAQSVDPNQLAKDQKTAQQLSDNDTKLKTKREATVSKIDKAKETIQEHEHKIKELKESKVK